MKGILQFVLPEENEEYRTAQDGWKWRDVVASLDGYLREKVKHGEMKDSERAIYQEIKDQLFGFIETESLVLF